MKNLSKIIAPSVFSLVTVLLSPCSSAQTTTTLLNLNFNDTNSTYPAWGSRALTGLPGDGVSTLRPTTTNSGLFPTAPTNGYLALTPNASAVISNTYWNGWAANATLATINSPYTAGGLGQTDLNKISLTARVRARGMPADGAVVILKIQAAGDMPNLVTSGYKRIMFEPVFLAGNDWTTIGGAFDDASLTNNTAQGTRYNFLTNAASYQVLVELSGFNRTDTTGYVAYANNPTVPAGGGRKNPGFDLNASGVRVEIDDVKLVVTDAATTGYAAPTTPSQLLRNGNFDTGEGNWSFFEGAYLSTEGWGENGNANVALIPGFSGLPYAGFMQNQIDFSPTNGSFFTLTFRGKFEPNYSAGQTLVTFMNGNDTQSFKSVEINDQVAANLGSWATYTARFNASATDLAAMNGKMSVKVQPLLRVVGAEQASGLIDDLVLSQQSASAVGPQIAVTLSGSSLTNGATVTVPDALVGFTSSYSLQIANNGAEDLVLSNVTATGGFTLAPATLPITIPNGSFRTLSLKAAPTAAGAFSGSVTIANNDKETADRSFTFTIGSSARPTTENFTSGTPASLGFASQFAGPTTLLGTSTLTVTNGTLRLTLDTSDNNVVERGTSWYYGIQKEFASPGVLDLAATTFQVSLRAFGVYAGTAGLKNKVEVRLESLDAPRGAATGYLQLGLPLDVTGYGAGAVPTFTPDGTYDRVALELDEGGNFVTAGGTVATLAANTGTNSLARAVNGWVGGASTTGTLTPTRPLKTDAPFFRIVVLINQSEFDYDSNNVVEIDSLTFSPGTSAVPVPTLTMANPGFELDSTLGSGAAPVSWAQYPLDGVMKELAATGAAIYNQAAGGNDATATITAHSGANTMKLRGAYYYNNDVFIPTRGFVYQEFKDLVAAGESVQLKARLYTASIDPLTGGSKAYLTLKFFDGLYSFLGSQSTEVNSANQVTNVWTEYAVTGTMPSGATIVQAGIEYAQNAGTDNGSVYADTFSIAKVTTTPLSAFDQWVADNSLAGQSFAVVGNRYAFGASRPQVSGVASIPSLSGTTLSYPYDLRNDSTLTVTAQYSTDLVNWNDLPAGFTTNGTGAPTGFTRKLLSVGVGSEGVPTPKSFIRLKVTRTP
jgi:hypothetical protein